MHEAGQIQLTLLSAAAQVSVVSEEVEQLGGVCHPEGERTGDGLLLLQRQRRCRCVQTQHLADGTFRLLLSPDLPGSPSLSWPPFCLWSVLHCASAPWREGRVCVGEQIVPQHRGRRRARAWSEPWSCWCNVGLQTGSSPQLEKERNQQGAPAHSETEGSCAESWRSGLYSPFSQRMILIGSPGRSERSEYGLPVWFEAKTRRDIMTNKLWFTFFTKRRLTGVGLPPRLSFRCKHASVDQQLFLWPEC